MWLVQMWQFKYALRSILLVETVLNHHKLETVLTLMMHCVPSGLLNISSKRNQQRQEVEVADDLNESAYEAMLIQLD